MARRDARALERELRRQAGRCPRPRNGHRCKSRRCDSCGVLWAGDTRVKLLRNIEAYGGDVAIVTVTAPGCERLPWDATGQRVRLDVARRWNRDARHNWRAIHRKASQRASRVAARAGGSWAVIARSWEFQKRGVLHVHVVVPMSSPLDRICSQAYAEALDELRQAHDFGYVDRGRRTRKGASWRRLLEVVPQQRAARYLAKYIAPIDGDKLALTETVRHLDVPGHVVYVSRHLTAKTGCTMRTLRRRRYAHMLLSRALDRAELTGDFDQLDWIAREDLDDEAVIALLAPRPPTSPD